MVATFLELHLAGIFPANCSMSHLTTPKKHRHLLIPPIDLVEFPQLLHQLCVTEMVDLMATKMSVEITTL